MKNSLFLLKKKEKEKQKPVSKLLLLLGPSGAGKTTVIRKLLDIDGSFRHIITDTTRSLRAGEVDKRSITDEEMDKMIQAGVYITVNTYIDGNRYATPRKPVSDALDKGDFPILDWPIKNLSAITKEFPTYTVYLSPPSLSELRSRLANDNRDPDGTRFKAAETELNNYWAGKFKNLIDLDVVNQSQRSGDAAQLIYNAYRHNLTK